jgi:NADH-quinone oxidoreductase E subunit
MTVAFKPEVKKEFEDIAARYAQRRAALLPALWLAQREFGWISTDAMKAVAELVGCSPAQVLETASFYTMYRKQKPGRHHLQVCRTLSCLLAGAEEVQKKVRDKLGIEDGETTKDGMFSYQEVECLASCHTGPCMRVNDEYYENLTPEGVAKLIEDLRKK